MNYKLLLHDPLESLTLSRHPLSSCPAPRWDRPHSLLLLLNGTGYCTSRNRSVALAFLVHGVLTPIHRTCYSRRSSHTPGVYIPTRTRLGREIAWCTGLLSQPVGALTLYRGEVVRDVYEWWDDMRWHFTWHNMMISYVISCNLM